MALDFQVSSIISEQLPEFVQSDYPTFISFLENYYEYLEKTGHAGEVIQNLAKYNDIDLTQSTWIDYFLKYYAEDIPKNARLDDKILIKVLTELYNRKGSDKAVKMLFRLLYGAESEVQYPYEFVLRASGGHWQAPVSLKIRSATGDLAKLIGTTITGEASGATGYVVDIIKYVLNKEIIFELFLDRRSITGTFISYETINGTYSSLNSTVLIKNIYLDIFDRQPTESEISDVLDDLNNGIGLDTILIELLNTAPVLALSNLNFINKVYYVSTGRVPDADTLFYEHTRLTQGISKSVIINDAFTTINSVRYLKNYSTSKNSITVTGVIIPVISGLTIVEPGRNYNIGDVVTVQTNLGKAFGVVSDVDLNPMQDFSDYEIETENEFTIITESGNILGQEIDRSTVSLPNDQEILLEDGSLLLYNNNTSAILESILYKPSNSLVKIEMTDCYTLLDAYTDIKDFEILLENNFKILNEDLTSNAAVILETPIIEYIRDFEFLTEDEYIIKDEDGFSSLIQEDALFVSYAFSSPSGGPSTGIRGNVEIISGPLCRYYGDWKNQQSRISINNTGSVTPGRYDTGIDSIIRRRFIERVFYFALDRIPTTLEFREYEGKIMNGVLLSDIIAEITTLPDALATTSPLYTNTQFLTGLYRICVNREPESSGFDYWNNLLVVTNTENFINTSFFTLLGRLPNSEERTRYLNLIELNSNKLDKMKLMIKQVLALEEATRYLADFNNFLNSLYRATVNRFPRDTERTEYFNLVQKGGTRDQITDAVSSTLECSLFYSNTYINKTPRQLIAKSIAEQPESITFLEQFQYRDVLIKDPVYYSPFSYTIMAQEPKIKWERPVRDLVHPAGLQSFGRVKVFVKNSV